MRVLITGSTGFLGSVIARACVAAGIEVSAILRPNSSLARLDGIVERITFHDNTEVGIHDALNCAGGCDSIIHAATCYGRQGETWTTVLESNSLFPLRILEKALTLGVSQFINIDTVLDSRINAYALSKRQFSDWGHLLLKTSKLRFVNVRLGHLYGPGDNTSGFVIYIIRQCLANAESIELTEGKQMRDFIYIDDAVSGIMQLLNSRENLPTAWSEFYLGSGHPVSIRQLVERIHQLIKSRSNLCFGKIPYRENEPMESKTDISKLIEFGWDPRTSLDEGLIQTIVFEKTKLIAEAHE